MEKFGFMNSEIDEKNDQLLISRQSTILLNAKKDSYARDYLKKHGEGVSTISFQVENCEQALKEAANRGAQIVRPLEKMEDEHGTYFSGAIQGFGDVYNEFIERPHTQFRPGFTKIDPPTGAALTTRAARIDHLTNNVPRGQLEQWVEFYERVYGFTVTRYFDIKGKKQAWNLKLFNLMMAILLFQLMSLIKTMGKDKLKNFLSATMGQGFSILLL